MVVPIPPSPSPLALPPDPPFPLVAAEIAAEIRSLKALSTLIHGPSRRANIKKCSRISEERRFLTN